MAARAAFLSVALMPMVSEADTAADRCLTGVKHDVHALLGCIHGAALWHDLVELQHIADTHKDRDGHGNRDTGTSGYAASVSYVAGQLLTAGYHVTVQPYKRNGLVDYNVIAENSLGDPAHVVVVDAHLDSIFGAGILDNGSGSATILEIARQMARTPTANRIRYIWFGGEELGLWGSNYYTTTLTPHERERLAFDIDVDVTATPNYSILIADPGHAPNARKFPRNVVPQSRRGNRAFSNYFASIGVPSRDAPYGNYGTDSNSFSLIGVPNSGILTGQDCCRQKWERTLWGGYLGDYDGEVPGYHHACVDTPNRWCDNLTNVNRQVFEPVSRSVAYTVWTIANDHTLGR